MESEKAQSGFYPGSDEWNARLQAASALADEQARGDFADPRCPSEYRGVPGISSIDTFDPAVFLLILQRRKAQNDSSNPPVQPERS
jgi:hypothetical protein